MRLTFDVAGTAAEFRRDWFTGSAKLVVGGESISLQRATDIETHFSWSLTKTWTATIDGHLITVEKRRARFLAGFRPQVFRVTVDGAVVAEATGY